MHWHKILLWGLIFLTPIASSSKPYCPPRRASRAEQRRIFNQFVQLLYIESNFTQAFTEHVSVDYITHNPFVQDGRAAAIAFFAQPFFRFAHTDVLRLLVDDDLTVVHRRSTIPGSPVVAGADFYRFDGTCIVEHWDVIQALPPNATNPHPLF